MRLLALALLLPLSAPPQDPTPEQIIAEMEARAPRFKDIDVRYVARMMAEDEVEIAGETRLVVLPGTGIRTDCSVLAVRSRDRDFQDIDFDVASVELPDDLYFWGAVHRGPQDLFAVLPPCLSLKGARKDHGVTVDVFPADFPFRWSYEDSVTLYGLTPKAAFARDPGLKAAGKRVVDGRTCHVLEISVPQDKMPADSILRMFPMGSPLKRYYVDSETWRLSRFELEFGVDNDVFYFRTEVKSRREISGVSIPDEIETSVGQRRAGRPDRVEVTIRKKLSSAWVDRGLSARDLLPDERKKDLHAESPMKDTAFYNAAIRKEPKNAAWYAGRALARYRDAIMQSLGNRREPRLDPAEAIADLEKAQEIFPSSPFVILSLLKFYELTNHAEKLSALAKAVEEQPIDSIDVRIALARHWIAAKDGDRAVKQLEKIKLSESSPLRLRLTTGQLWAAAFAMKGDTASAGKALAGLFAGAGVEERRLFLDALAPIPTRGRPAGGEEKKELQSALDAALALDPKSGALQELRLRLALLSGESEKFVKALETYVDGVDDAASLIFAASLALQVMGDMTDPQDSAAVFKAVGEKLVAKLPSSPDASALYGLALLKAGDKDAALKRLTAVLDGLEKEETTAANASGRAQLLMRLAPAFSDASAEVPLLRTAVLFVKCLNLTARPYRYLRGGNDDPISMCVTHLLSKSKYVEVFKTLKDLDREKISYLYTLRELMRSHEQEFSRVVKEDLLKNSKDVLDYRKFATLLQMVANQPKDTMEVLEKARELAPADVEVAYELAVVYQGIGRDSNRAIQLYEEVLTILEKTPGDKVDRNMVLFQVAQLYGRGARHEKAVDALDRIDLNATVFPYYYYPSIAQLYEQAQSLDKAVAILKRYLEKETNPYNLAQAQVHVRLGQLCEKRQDYEEAYRAYTQGMEVIQKAREQYGERDFGGNPAALREALLRKIGDDYFIDKFLEKKLDPLTAEEEKRAKELYEKLRSESLSDRDDAFEELKKMGPRVAPVIKDGLRSSDSELKSRVRQLLQGWAEPK